MWSHLSITAGSTPNNSTPVRQLQVLLCCRTTSVSGNAPAIQTSGHVTDAEQDQPQVLAGSSNGAAEKVEQSSSLRQQPITGAATAVDSDTTTTVIDSIPWGSSGTATARGHQVSPQTGGGSGASTGGTTGGGGGGSHRPSGASGGGDGGHRSSSTWQQWWLGLLLVGGGATAISMSSAAKTAFKNAVAAIKARFASGNLLSLQVSSEGYRHQMLWIRFVASAI